MSPVAGMQLIDMPHDGLWRAGRYADLYHFPPPARPVALDEPLREGYLRWEDLRGHFATVKYSASGEAAVGRTIARFGQRRIDGSGFIDVVKGWLTHPADDELVPAPNTVPSDYFEDAHELWIPPLDVLFVDLESGDTREALRASLGPILARYGLEIREGLTRDRDRRLTRLVTSTLHALSAAPGYERVAGLRYAGHTNPSWDAYVFWSRPSRLDLANAEVEPLDPSHPSVQAAAETLGIDLPVSG